MKDKKEIRERMSLFEYGKIPPQSTKIEEAILGACLLDGNAIAIISDKLRPEHFYLDSHQKIYAAIYDMHNVNETIDILTVNQKLKSRQELEVVGGYYYVSQLTQGVGSAFHIEAHAEIIKNKWVLREMISISAECSNKSYEDPEDAIDLINSMSSALINVTGTMAGDIKPISEISDSNYERILKIRSGEVKSFGIPTMFTDLDRLINGLQPPDLIILAGRPGMGKTALMINLIKNMSLDRDLPCAIFSLEMSSEQLELRFETIMSGIPYFNLQNGKFNDDQLEAYEKGRSVVRDAKIIIDDDSRNTIESVRTKSIQFKNKHDIKAIFVDYIQLMDGNIKGVNREGQISTISRGLKSLAKELNVPIIAMSQLNREVERLTPPEPKLSHLRESGSIEQDSDIVVFLYRPEYYKIGTIERKGEIIDTENLCVFDIAKHRNGPTGKILMKFYKNTMEFADYTTAPEPVDRQETIAITEELPF